MSNPIFKALGGNMKQNNLVAQFEKFKQKMQGINPNEEIEKLLQSGAISQQQLNEVQQMAQQFKNLLRQ